jgi:nucleoid-associated protein YgaU
MSLRSYSVLQAENESLKAAGEKLATEKSALEAQLAEARTVAAAEPSREQLRQLQAQSTALASENAQLKTRLSLVPPAARPAAPAAVSISAPTRPGAPFPAATTTVVAPSARTHTVVAGDTLARISRLYYGNAGRWPEILAANRDVLRDERGLVVGRTLVIP